MKGQKTGGRTKGTPNKASAAKVAEVAASGTTPLDYLLDVMRGSEDAAQRLEAAKAAAPYVHPKLQPVDGKTGSAEIRAHVLVEFVGKPA